MKLKYLLIIAATGLTSFLSTYLSASVNLASKTIGLEYGVNPSDLSLITSIYLLFSSICIIPFGKVSDMLGPKKTLLFGCGFFIVSNILVLVFAYDFTLLLIFRGLQGIAAALLVVSNTPIISMAIPTKYKTTALGILSGLVYFGTSAGNFIGGVLTELFGWRSVFVVAAVCGVVALAIIHFAVPDREKTEFQKKTIDIQGIFFFAVTLTCLQFGSNKLDSLTGQILMVGFIVFMVLFIYRQFHSSNPIFDVKMFVSNSTFAMSNLAVFFNFFATFGSQYLLTLYLQCNRGMSPIEAGKIMLFQPFMQLFVSPLAGFIADKTSRGLVSSTGMGFITVGLYMFAGLSADTSVIYIYIAVVLTGIGISLFSAPNTSIIMGSVPENKRGMAAASNSIMRSLGMQSSIILCGSMFLLTIGNVKGIPPEKYEAMLEATKLCYIIFIVSCIIGMIVSLKRNKTPKTIME